MWRISHRHLGCPRGARIQCLYPDNMPPLPVNKTAKMTFFFVNFDMQASVVEITNATFMKTVPVWLWGLNNTNSWCGLHIKCFRFWWTASYHTYCHIRAAACGRMWPDVMMWDLSKGTCREGCFQPKSALSKSHIRNEASSSTFCTHYSNKHPSPVRALVPKNENMHLFPSILLLFTLWRI